MTIDVRTMRSTPPGYFTVRWGLPEYTDWIDESISWKETCYIGDWSFLWERRFRGPDVLKLFSIFLSTVSPGSTLVSRSTYQEER
jgi:vanillate/3-O-methylgallate O-demethylase